MKLPIFISFINGISAAYVTCDLPKSFQKGGKFRIDCKNLENYKPQKNQLRFYHEEELDDDQCCDVRCRYDRRSDFSEKIRCAYWNVGNGALFSKGYATENWLHMTDFEDYVCGDGCPAEEVTRLYGEGYTETCRNQREVMVHDGMYRPLSTCSFKSANSTEEGRDAYLHCKCDWDTNEGTNRQRKCSFQIRARDDNNEVVWIGIG